MTVTAASLWKRGLAAVLDFLTVFVAAGYGIAKASGSTTASGFELNGGPALLLFAIVAGYFVVGRRFAGGTLWDRVLGISRPQPR
jgi:hypothetical protein